MKMTIEEKMAYIRKALEMGASVDINIHTFKEEEKARAATKELSKMFNFKHNHRSHGGSNWYKIKSDDYTLETAIFYDDENYMEEDIWATEEEEAI